MIRTPLLVSLLCLSLFTAAAFAAPHTPAPGAATTAPAFPQPRIREFLGICGHTVLFRPELYRPAVQLVRDYHPIDWDLGADSATLPKWPFAKNRVDWSKVYGSWSKAGYDTDACLMEIPPTKWKDLESDARAYAASFAKTFGPSGGGAGEWPSRPGSVELNRGGTPRPLEGSGVVHAAEIGNEPGSYDDPTYTKWFAAMARGLREGDARLLIATCNLTLGKSHKYAKSVTCLEGLNDLFDVLTVHIYAETQGWPTWRRSCPEDPATHFLATTRDFMAWRDQHAPGKQLWITEFGWDASTRKPTAKNEFAKWEGSTDLQQAQWLVRATLCLSALSVQRAYIYFFNDDDTPQLHGSSGITRKFQKKPSFYALAQMQQVLGACRFKRIVVDRPNELCVYEYADPDHPAERIWAIWSPTATGRSASVDIDFPAAAGRQLLFAAPPGVAPTPGPGSAPESAPATAPAAAPESAPEWQPVMAHAGKLTVAVSESPLYVAFKATAP